VTGQIIVVSGTSGSGKSTTCELFAKRADDFWLLYGIDNFLASSFPAKFGHHGPRCDEGFAARPLDEECADSPMRWHFGEFGTRGFGVFHEWVASASREGCNIIIDHLLITDPPILQDCVRRWRGLPVLSVILKPPYAVLMERIDSRKMGKKMDLPEYPASEREQKIRERLQRLRPWFYESVYANTICDIQIDTVEHNPEQVCELIENRLAEGPGVVFEQLASQDP